MPLAEFLFCIFCDAEKKVGVTTSGTYYRGWDGTFSSHSLQGLELLGNPC